MSRNINLVLILFHRHPAASLTFKMPVRQRFYFIDLLHNNMSNLDKAPQGSWEYVAASIYWDSVYQRGLYMLDVHIAQSGNITNAQLPAYVDGLEEAVSCLVSVLETVDSVRLFLISNSTRMTE